MSRPAEKIVVRPVITEKTSQLQYDGTDAERSEKVQERSPAKPKYTFEVASDATKPEIKRAVEQLFDVHVKAVRTQNYMGKKRRVRRAIGRKPSWKKAIVTLAEGEMIDVFEGV